MRGQVFYLSSYSSDCVPSHVMQFMDCHNLSSAKWFKFFNVPRLLKLIFEIRYAVMCCVSLICMTFRLQQIAQCWKNYRRIQLSNKLRSH